MKKDFFTGLVLLLPAVLTIILLVLILRILTNPFMGPVSAIFEYFGIFNKPFFIFSQQQILNFGTRATVLLVLLIFTIFVGILGRGMLLNLFVNACENGIRKIPFICKIYKGFKEIINTVLGKKENKFSGVVLVPFPHSKVRSIGLITSHNSAPGSDKQYSDLVSVFVPGTPNPTMGFMLLYRKDQITYVNMKVSDALKFLVSCGVVLPSSQEL